MQWVAYKEEKADTTRNKEMNAKTSEKVAKELQPSTGSNRNQSATIPAIVKSPDITYRARDINYGERALRHRMQLFLELAFWNYAR